jgi:hypothetical protein
MDEVSPHHSTPRIQDFNPREIPFQIEVLKYLRREFDFSQGTAELLLSGSVGSAKTILAAHTVVTHAIENTGSQQIVVRRALKDLKNTFWRVMLDHWPELRRWWNKSEMRISLPNGSIIYGSSYDDGDFTRFRSYELSGAVIEEATEGSDPELYHEIFDRIGRISHVEENYMMLVTNPDGPSHWIYDLFMDNPKPTRKVFYSLTEGNPFLKPSYIKQLKQNMDPKRAQRMLEGKWIEIRDEVIYHAYSAKNFIDGEYDVNPKANINVTFDFNIGDGKPMSAACAQYVEDTFHIFSEHIIHGARTESLLEDMANKCVFDRDILYVINGDATGNARSTKAIHSDYEIIKTFLSNYKRPDGSPVRFRLDVPRSNPPIKERHNKVNAYCQNANGDIRLKVYKTCPMVDKGFRLTALKRGGNYIEDDSKEWQHVTTAIGYMVCTQSARSKEMKVQVGRR